MTEPILPPLKPIPIKDRISVAHVEKGNIDVLDGAFVVVDKTGSGLTFPWEGWSVSCWNPELESLMLRLHWRRA